MKRSISAGCVAILIAACSSDSPPPPESGTDTVTFGPNDTLPPTGMSAPPALFPIDLLLGAWSADGENFVWVIEADSILFEIDMLRHPYQLVGDTLIIDRGDPTIGIQKTRILRLTADTLLIQDVQSGTSEPLLRLR
jgi:hypothetical protein